MAGLTIDCGAIFADPYRLQWNIGGILSLADGGGFTIVPQSPFVQHRAVIGTTEPAVIEDRNYNVVSGSSVVTDYIWNWLPADTNVFDGTVSRESLNPLVLIPDESNPYLWTYVGPGIATIRLLTSSGLTYSRTVTTSASGSGVTYELTGYVAGSLRKHIIDLYDGLIAGKTPADSIRIFSTYSPSTATYVRNPAVWTGAFDLSCISPGNSSSFNLWAGAMVSPRHFVVCAHASMSVGSVLHLVGMDGTLVTRTITNIVTAPGYVNYYPDWRVGVLNADVPTSGPGAIKFAKVLPDNWAAKIPSLSAQNPLPALCLDQEEKALATDLATITSQAGFYGAMASYTIPTDLQRQAFYEPKIGGDSGNPSFLLIGADLVLINVWTSGGPGSGTSITYWKSAINTIMTSLGGGYQLTEVDLSEFPEYS